MKTITKSQLSCLPNSGDVTKRFIEQTNNADEPVEIISLYGGKNTIGDLCWLAYAVCEPKKIDKFIKDLALVNVASIKDYCNGNDYDTVIKFLNGHGGFEPETIESIARDCIVNAEWYAGESFEFIGDKAYKELHKVQDAAFAVISATEEYDSSDDELDDIPAVDVAYYLLKQSDGKFDFKPYLMELFS